MSRCRRRRGAAAFTLLEVLAAVAVMGLVFTLLARANIEGLRAEGVSERKLNASLLADRLLADLEGQLAAGTAPPLGRSEREEEDFRVLLDVSPLEISLPAASPAESSGAPPGSALTSSAGAAPTLLAAPGSDAPTPLRRVHLEVAWPNGVGEESVVRDTIVFDALQAEPLLAGLASQDGGPGGEDEQADDTDEVEEPEFTEPLIPLPDPQEEER